MIDVVNKSACCFVIINAVAAENCILKILIFIIHVVVCVV